MKEIINQKKEETKVINNKWMENINEKINKVQKDNKSIVTEAKDGIAIVNGLLKVGMSEMVEFQTEKKIKGILGLIDIFGAHVLKNEVLILKLLNYINGQKKKTPVVYKRVLHDNSSFVKQPVKVLKNLQKKENLNILLEKFTENPVKDVNFKNVQIQNEKALLVFLFGAVVGYENQLKKFKGDKDEVILHYNNFDLIKRVYAICFNENRHLIFGQIEENGNVVYIPMTHGELVANNIGFELFKTKETKKNYTIVDSKEKKDFFINIDQFNSELKD